MSAVLTRPMSSKTGILNKKRTKLSSYIQVRGQIGTRLTAILVKLLQNYFISVLDYFPQKVLTKVSVFSLFGDKPAANTLPRWQAHKREGEGKKKPRKGKRRGRPFSSLPNPLSLFPPFPAPFDACHVGYLHMSCEPRNELFPWSLKSAPAFIAQL